MQAARSSGVLEPGTDAHGPSHEEVKKSQKVTPSQGLTQFADSSVRKVGADVLAAGYGVAHGLAAATVGIGVTAYHLLEKYVEAHEQGAEQNRAYQRDSVHLATAWAAASALPPSYLERVNENYTSVGGSSPGVGGGGANRIVNQLLAKGQWAEASAQATRDAQLGRDLAQQLRVHSQEALANRLSTDPKFEAMYSQNIAFKHGVDSVVFEAPGPATSASNPPPPST